MKGVVGAVTAVTVLVLAASPAAAHTAGAPQATNYRSRLIGVVPPQPGVVARVYDLGKRIKLVNNSGADVIVIGYQGEPYLRVGRDGVFENRRSPTLYRNRTTVGGGPGPVPSTADAAAPPDWHKVSRGRSVTWGDDRTKHTGPDPAAVKQQPGRTHVVVPQWTIPLRRGDADLAVVGSITWVPGTSALPWVAVAAVVAALVVLGGRSRWWGPILSATTAVLIALDAVHAVALAGSGGRSVGAATVRLLAGSYLSVGAWAAGIAAVIGLQEEREGGLLAACFCGAVIAVLSGVTDLASLSRSQLPVGLPTGFVRFTVAMAIGGGGGLLAAAASRLAAMPAEREAV